MFGKFFASAFTGSMAGAGSHVFAVWGYIIANAVESQVEVNPRVVSPLIGATEQDVVDALDYLCRPDANSRSLAEDGRRLIKEGAFAYFVVNHHAYRVIRDEEDRRAYNRRKKAEGRARGVNARVKRSIRESNVSANTEAEAEAEAEITHRQEHVRVSGSTRISEKPTDEIGRRAAAFIDRYTALYPLHRGGARFLPKPALDYQTACDLVRTWPDDRLEKLAIIFLKTDHDFAASGSRTLRQFAALASWCDGRLADVEKGRAS